MKPERIGTLADGIFAISMTLLILDIHVPQVEMVQWSDISMLLPKLLSLATSFLILSIYWSSHHMLFARLAKADFKFMWRNLWFMLLITIVPFTTALVGEYTYSSVAQTVYAVNLILCAGVLYNTIFYAVHTAELFHEMPSLEFRRNVAGKILIPLLVYLLAIIISYWNTKVSLALLVFGPLSYFISIDSKMWAVLTKPIKKYIV